MKSKAIQAVQHGIRVSLGKSQQSTTALVTPCTGATPSSSLGYTTPGRTAEGVDRVLFPMEDLTLAVLKEVSVEKKTSELSTAAEPASTCLLSPFSTMTLP